eukprot:UN22707
MNSLYLPSPRDIQIITLRHSQPISQPIEYCETPPLNTPLTKNNSSYIENPQNRNNNHSIINIDNKLNPILTLTLLDGTCYPEEVFSDASSGAGLYATASSGAGLCVESSGEGLYASCGAGLYAGDTTEEITESVGQEENKNIVDLKSTKVSLATLPSNVFASDSTCSELQLNTPLNRRITGLSKSDFSCSRFSSVDNNQFYDHLGAFKKTQLNRKKLSLNDPDYVSTEEVYRSGNSLTDNETPTSQYMFYDKDMMHRDTCDTCTTADEEPEKAELDDELKIRCAADSLNYNSWLDASSYNLQNASDNNDVSDAETPAYTTAYTTHTDTAAGYSTDVEKFDMGQVEMVGKRKRIRPTSTEKTDTTVDSVFGSESGVDEELNLGSLFNNIRILTVLLVINMGYLVALFFIYFGWSDGVCFHEGRNWSFNLDFLPIDYWFTLTLFLNGTVLLYCIHLKSKFHTNDTFILDTLFYIISLCWYDR